MKLENSVLKFLNGVEFDNGLDVKVSQPELEIITRLDKLEKLTKNKRIVHLGCCDHIPLIKEKIKNNIWLHARITKDAERCIGVDIDEEGINYLKSELNYDNVVKADITSDVIEEITSSHWDYIVIGEILEHIDNPVDFLSKIKKLYGGVIDKVIITVPNAFSYTNFSGIKQHCEIINSDHRYWFSPYTLAKVGTIAGLKLQEFFYVQEVKPTIGLKPKLMVFPYFKRIGRINRLKKYPAFRDTILAVLTFAPDEK